MRFPGVPFPMLGNPSLAGIVPIKQVAPHNVREGEWMELLEPLCWGQGRRLNLRSQFSSRVCCVTAGFDLWVHLMLMCVCVCLCVSHSVISDSL